MELMVRISRIQPLEVAVEKKGEDGETVKVKEPRTLVGVKIRSFDGFPCEGRFEVLVAADHKVPKLGSDVKLSSGGKKDKADEVEKSDGGKDAAAKASETFGG